MDLDPVAFELLMDPGDEETWAVYADALQSRGSPLGEHIALSMALEEAEHPATRSELEDSLAELHEREPAALLGSFRPADTPNARNFELEWYRGTIHKVRCRAQREYYDGPVTGPASFAALLPELLRLPAARFMRSLSVHTSRRPRHTAQVLAMLSRLQDPHGLERLHVGWGLYPTRTAYNLDPEILPTKARWKRLLRQLPRLRVLSLHGHLVPLPGFEGGTQQRLAAIREIGIDGVALDDATLTLLARAVIDREQEVQLAAIGRAHALGRHAQALIPSLSICLLRYIAPAEVQDAAKAALEAVGAQPQLVI